MSESTEGVAGHVVKISEVDHVGHHVEPGVLLVECLGDVVA